MNVGYSSFILDEMAEFLHWQQSLFVLPISCYVRLTVAATRLVFAFCSFL